MLQLIMLPQLPSGLCDFAPLPLAATRLIIEVCACVVTKSRNTHPPLPRPTGTRGPITILIIYCG